MNRIVPVHSPSLLDVINQWLVTIALLLVCVLLLWKLQPKLDKIEDKVDASIQISEENARLADERIDDLNEQLKIAQQAVLTFLKDKEQWEKAKPEIMKQMSQ